MPSDATPPDECANCGATIPRHAKSCPECGADERSGWRENDATRYDGLDLPASAFDDDTNASDTPQSAHVRPSRRRDVNGVPWYWWCVGVALLVALAIRFLT